MIAFRLFLLCSISGVSSAWMRMPFARLQQTMLLSSSSSSGSTNNHAQTEQQETTASENPCWQDLYDDDCSMTNIAAAHFVAAEWIKSMPCAAGIEDCDMPADLTVPETRPEAGVDHVDVMEFLGLKRSKSVGRTTKSDNTGNNNLAP